MPRVLGGMSPYKDIGSTGGQSHQVCRPRAETLGFRASCLGLGLLVCVGASMLRSGRGAHVGISCRADVRRGYRSSSVSELSELGPHNIQTNQRFDQRSVRVFLCCCRCVFAVVAGGAPFLLLSSPGCICFLLSSPGRVFRLLPWRGRVLFFAVAAGGEVFFCCRCRRA